MAAAPERGSVDASRPPAPPQLGSRPGRRVDIRAVAVSNGPSVSTRTRNTIAVLCVAAVVLAAFLPALSADLPPVVLTALWLVVPAVVVTMRRKAARCGQQPVALLSLVPSRAPPCRLALA